MIIGGSSKVTVRHVKITMQALSIISYPDLEGGWCLGTKLRAIKSAVSAGHVTQNDLLHVQGLNLYPGSNVLVSPCIDLS